MRNQGHLLEIRDATGVLKDNVPWGSSGILGNSWALNLKFLAQLVLSIHTPHQWQKISKAGIQISNLFLIKTLQTRPPRNPLGRAKSREMAFLMHSK